MSHDNESWLEQMYLLARDNEVPSRARECLDSGIVHGDGHAVGLLLGVPLVLELAIQTITKGGTGRFFYGRYGQEELEDLRELLLQFIRLGGRMPEVGEVVKLHPYWVDRSELARDRRDIRPRPYSITWR